MVRLKYQVCFIKKTSSGLVIEIRHRTGLPILKSRNREMGNLETWNNFPNYNPISF